jgi:transcriptional repressor NrdR
MRCPHCGKFGDKVLDSRRHKIGDAVRRRRECLSCGYRFTSFERIEEKPLMVVKRDGRREPFDRKKLERGLRHSIQKRPVPELAVERIVNEVEERAAFKAGEARELKASIIGGFVLRKLYKLDKVAYIRFASVYRRYENLEEFVSEIKRLTERAITE